MDAFLKRSFRFVKRRGMRGVLEKLHLVSSKNEFLKHYEFIMQTNEVPLDGDAYRKHKDDERILLNWIIPEMGEGSGGHINIFRFVSLLENMGFHSRLYLVLSPGYKNNNRRLNKDLTEKFPILDSRVEAFWDIEEASFAHATIATSWETAYFVRNFNNTISKFYFVQDYEPFFFPRGSFYQFAKHTYDFGLRGIAAGDWLKDMLWKNHGMRCDSFAFSYDKKLYIPQEQTKPGKRVFFYARPVTQRRDFEIGLVALDYLCRKMPDVKVIMAGWKIEDNIEVPFLHEDKGIASLEQLPDIYRQCDMCLVMSNTNLSLLPLEIMGSGSVVVSSRGDNNEWMLNDSNAILVDYDPLDIAKRMEYFFNNPRELSQIRRNGIEYARSTSWGKEAVKVKEALMKGIREDVK